MEYRPDPPVYMGGEKHNTPEAEFTMKRSTIKTVTEFVQAAATPLSSSE